MDETEYSGDDRAPDKDFEKAADFGGAYKSRRQPFIDDWYDQNKGTLIGARFETTPRFEKYPIGFTPESGERFNIFSKGSASAARIAEANNLYATAAA